MSTTTTSAPDAAHPYQDKIAEARRFLEQRGIRDVKPLYRAAPGPAAATPATRRAEARWFRAVATG